MLTKYPHEVKAFRTQSAKAKTAFVVHIDADPQNTVAARHAQLAAELKVSGEAPRRPDEAIAELVPKRNIEAWIYALDPSLLGRLKSALDESHEFPKFGGFESECFKAAEAFADHARQKTTPPTTGVVPSLLDGFAEFRRLL